jgi:hypothetical protein
MARSGYVLAGFETLATIIDMFIDGRRGKYEDNFSRDDVSRFLADNCSGYLHSYGQNFPNKKKYGKYSQVEADMYRQCRDMGIFDNCNLIVDSGGFQISVGQLTRKESDLLLNNMYYDFLVDHYDVYDSAFILDVPPGPGCEIFKNFKDVYDLNMASYQKAKALPDHVRKKLIYIHHFRTPKLWEIYTKILRDGEMFTEFENHGTGGIVANMASDMSIPCIIYVLPLIPLLNEAKKYGRKYLNFHILGGSNFRDVLFYELFKITVKKYHDIDLNITYDSSGPYKQVMQARFLNVMDDQGYMRKMNIKSQNLDMKFMTEATTSDLTVLQKYQEILDNLSDQSGFKRMDIEGVYGMYPNRSKVMTETFHPGVKSYTMLYALSVYPMIQEQMKEFAHRVFPIYESGDLQAFYKECFDITRHINQGKLTKKQKIKAYSIPRSLDMLRDLDEDYCLHLVTKFLSKDEFTELNDVKGVLGF